MKKSLRRFHYLRIVIDDFYDWQLKRLLDILQNIGDKVESLYIDAVGKTDVEVEQSALVSWLNSMPNLQKISAGGLYSCKENRDDPTTLLNLSKLRSVSLCPLGLGLKLHQMPKASIQFLQLNDKVPLPNAEEVFKLHSETFRTLQLFRTVYTDPMPFRHLKLTKFSCLYQEFMNNRIHNEFLMDIIEHQTKLKTLDLGEGDLTSNCYPVNSELLNLICEKTELEELSIGFNLDVTPGDVNQMRKLKNLKQLLLQTSFYDFEVNSEVLEAFASTKIPTLKSLRLEANVADMTQQVMRTLGESFPYLEEYIGDFNIHERENELSTFNVFLDAFPNLTTLELLESHYEFIPGRIYPKMKKLNLWCETNEINISAQLIKSLPNLEELQVENMVPRYSTLRAILKSKITKIDITISSVEDISEKRLKKIQKIASRIMDKGDECSIVFPDEDGDFMFGSFY